jgi:hypothetical protein
MKTARFILIVFGCVGLISANCPAQNARPHEKTSRPEQENSVLRKTPSIQPGSKKEGPPKSKFTENKPGTLQNRGNGPSKEPRIGTVHPVIPSAAHTLARPGSGHPLIYGMTHTTPQYSPRTMPHVGAAAPGFGHKNNGPPVIGGPASSPRTLTGLNGTTLKRRP